MDNINSTEHPLPPRPLSEALRLTTRQRAYLLAEQPQCGFVVMHGCCVQSGDRKSTHIDRNPGRFRRAGGSPQLLVPIPPLLNRLKRVQAGASCKYKKTTTFFLLPPN